MESNCSPDLTSDEEGNGDKSEASSTNLVDDGGTEEDAKSVTSRRDETGDRRIGEAKETEQGTRIIQLIGEGVGVGERVSILAMAARLKNDNKLERTKEL